MFLTEMRGEIDRALQLFERHASWCTERLKTCPSPVMKPTFLRLMKDVREGLDKIERAIVAHVAAEATEEEVLVANEYRTKICQIREIMTAPSGANKKSN